MTLPHPHPLTDISVTSIISVSWIYTLRPIDHPPRLPRLDLLSSQGTLQSPPTDPPGEQGWWWLW